MKIWNPSSFLLGSVRLDFVHHSLRRSQIEKDWKNGKGKISFKSKREGKRKRKRIETLKLKDPNQDQPPLSDPTFTPQTTYFQGGGGDVG
jgi:hypothetical protein